MGLAELLLHQTRGHQANDAPEPGLPDPLQGHAPPRQEQHRQPGHMQPTRAERIACIIANGGSNLVHLALSLIKLTTGKNCSLQMSVHLSATSVMQH